MSVSRPTSAAIIACYLPLSAQFEPSALLIIESAKKKDVFDLLDQSSVHFWALDRLFIGFASHPFHHNVYFFVKLAWSQDVTKIVEFVLYYAAVSFFPLL